MRLFAGGLEAWGECVAEETPYYSAETNETAWHIITGFLGPTLLAASTSDPREIFPSFRAVRGHNMAKAALEMACWDLFARAEGVPLSRAARRRPHPDRVGRVDRHPGLARAARRQGPRPNSTPATGG